MKKSTTASFALISLWLFIALSCASTRQAELSLGNMGLHIENHSRYRVNIKTPKASFSGLMVIRKINNDWRGSLVNEFGIKAFDLETVNGKCKLRNLMPMLDKWYIRKTIERDFDYLLMKADRGIVERKRKIVVDDGFTLVNLSRHIEYSFKPIQQ